MRTKNFTSPPMLRLVTLTVCCVLAVSAGAQEPIFVDDKPTLVLEQGAGEGPAWHGEHGLFFSGGGNIHLLRHDGQLTVFMAGAGSNGLLLDSQGQLLICQPGSRRVSRLQLTTGELTVLTDAFRNAKYNQPNDITVDSQGRIYFSDPRYGQREDMQLRDASGQAVEGVYRIDRPGVVTRLISHEVDRPNGVLVSADDRYLFVADNNNNQSGGARKLWRFDLRADGTLDLPSQKLLLDWKTGRGPDGLVQDEQGRLYVAGGLNEPNPPHETAHAFKGGIYVLSPEGERLAFVPIPRDEVTNCTFGGPELRTLYVTAGGTLWSIRTHARGQLRWTGKSS